ASAAAIAPRAAARALRGSGAGPSTPVPAASRLAPLVARVTEPAYAHRPPRLVKEPVTISALVGGTIELVGMGPAAGMRAALGADSVAVADSGGAWSVRVPM